MRLLPLTLSSRFQLTQDGHVFDLVGRSHLPIPRPLYESLRQAAVAGAPVVSRFMEREPEFGRAVLWDLFQAGFFALGEIDAANAPQAHLVEYAFRYLTEVTRIPDLPNDLGSLVWALLRSQANADRRVIMAAEVADRLAQLQITSTPPRQDRNFFVCDSTRDVQRFVVGGGLERAIHRDLGILLKLCAYTAFRRERDVLRVLSRLVPAGTSVPLVTALRALSELNNHSRSLGTDPKRLALSDPHDDAGTDIRFEHSYDEGEGTLQIKHVEYPEAFERWLVGKRFVSTVDLMLRPHARGTPRVILNEAHPWGSGMPETTLFPLIQPGDRRQLYSGPPHAAAIFGDNAVVIPAEITKQSDAILTQLAGITVAVHSLETRVDPKSKSIPIGQLDIRHTDEGFCVADIDGSLYRLVSGMLCVGDIRIVGARPMTLSADVVRTANLAPVRLLNGGHWTPSIRIGDLLVARPVVRMACTEHLRELCTMADQRLLDEGKKLQEELRLGRWVFVSLAGEKPFYCDFASLFALEVLANELRDCRADITFAAMVPAPPDLWLELGDGAYTCELRFVVSGDGPAYGGRDFFSRDISIPESET